MNIIFIHQSDFGKEIFWCQGILLLEFWFKNGCKNEIKDNNEKSSSWSRNRVSHKIDLKAVWPLDGHAASLGVKFCINFEKRA